MTLVARIALAALAALAAAMPASALQVRVLLLRPSADKAATISASGLQYTHSSGAWAAYPGNTLTLVAAQLPSDAAAPLRLRCESGTMRVVQGENSWQYTGILEIPTTSPLRLINEVDLEDYLESVAPSEMPSSFPEEALKAQAVAARSYTMAGLGKHADLGADLCDTTCCQAYRGASAASDRSTSAVRQTKGQYLTTNGKPLHAQYSACCGGHTKAIPALGTSSAAVDAPSPEAAAYCSEARYFRWEYRLAQADLLKAAGESRPTPLRRLKVCARDNSGRIEKLELEHDFGTSELSGAAFREKIGNSRIRSTLCRFSVDLATGDLIVQGNGWGHGIGLCQWGARGMALAGRNYREILEHYYPGAPLSETQGATEPRQP